MIRLFWNLRLMIIPIDIVISLILVRRNKWHRFWFQLLKRNELFESLMKRVSLGALCRNRIIPWPFIVLRNLNFIFLRKLDSDCVAFLVYGPPVKIFESLVSLFMRFKLYQSLRPQLSLKHDYLLNKAIFWEYSVEDFNVDGVFDVGDCDEQHSSAFVVNVHVESYLFSICEGKEDSVLSNFVLILSSELYCCECVF